MKKICFAGAMALLVLATAGCSSVDSKVNEAETLYAEMLNYSSHYASLLVSEQFPSLKTKALDDLKDLMGGEPIFDVSNLDEKFAEYIDIYLKPEDARQWDEMATIQLVCSDNRFSQDEKELFAKSLAGVYYFKSRFADSISLTKSQEDQCLREYKKAVKRAARNGALALAAALLEPTVVGEALAAMYFLAEIEDAEEDLEDCLKDCEEDGNTENP